VGNVEATRSATFDVLGRVEETDSRIYYKGTWSSSPNAARSGGAWTYTSASGATAYLTFSGTGIDLIASKAPAYGIAKLTVDGGSPTYVDLYDASYLHQVHAWSSRGLSPGTHLLTLEWTGSKNASSAGTVVGIDAFDIVGTPAGDFTAPVTSDNAPSEWRSSPATVTLSVTETDTWIVSTRYSINGGPATTYTAPFGVSAEGTTSITYRSVDGAGNVEETRTATVRIDRVAPDVSDDAPAGWINTPVTVHLSATDPASGIGSVVYSTDLSDPTLPYGTGIMCASDGTTTIRHQAFDTVGNASAIKSAYVRIDQEAPQTSDDATDTWVKAPLSLRLSATDAHSGVAQTLCGVDGSDPATGPVVISADGTHTVRYRSIDAAGNAEPTNTVTVRVDGTAPVSSTNAVASYRTTATISISATDALSGVARTEYRLDASEWTEGSWISTTTPGTHTLEYRSTDAVGNVEATRSATFDVVQRYDDADSRVSYDGPWSLSSRTTRFAGSWNSVSATAAAHINFTGTAIDFIASRAPTYGIARITIDGTRTVSADLYASSFMDQQCVSRISGLSSGAHVLSLEWTGSKNASSTGTVVGIDALDITGSLTSAPPVSRRYEETDSRVGYRGTWMSGERATRSAGAWKYTNETGAGAYVNFTGTRIDFVASKAPTYGIVQVTVDSSPPQYIDLYSASYLDNQTTLSITGLANSAHVVKYEWTGTRNAAATGSTIGLDAVNVVGTLTQATAPPPTVTRYEQTDPHVVLEGTWATAANAARSDGSWAYSNSASDTAWISFTGTRVDLVASKAPGYGIAKVTIDGSSTAEIDLYDGGYLHQQVVYSASGLASAPHTLKIEWTGTKNASASGTTIGLDAIDIDGTIAQAMALHEQSDSRIAFHGTWATGANVARSSGSWAYTNSADAAAYVVFTGTRVDLVASKAPGYGIAKVTIDGSSTAEIDLYDGGYLHQQVVYSASGLANAPHTLKIEWTGTKNAYASGTTIGLDRVDTLGSMTEASDLSSPLIRHEEVAPQISFVGTWTPSPNTARSNGSWRAADSTASVSFTMTGTRLDVIVSKARSYGIAKLTVDGDSQYLDLYDPNYSHQVRIASLRGLADGSHSVTLEWTGTKNPSATGTTIGLDAIDVVGTLGP
jgi:hypothetical protein